MITLKDPTRGVVGTIFPRSQPSMRRELSRNSRVLIGGTILGVITLVAILAPAIAPADPNVQDLRSRFQFPSAEHLLGTDRFGRDLYGRIIWGSRISLLVAVDAMVIGLLAGTILGVVSAYYGKWVDKILTRLIDILMAYPAILLALAIMATLGPGLWSVVIAVGISTVPRVARVIRSEVILVMTQDYITSARVAGAGNARIMWRHVVPNVAPTLFVLASLYAANAILVESSLSFLGLGIPPPDPTLGGMLAEGQVALTSAWWVPVFPGLWLTLAVLALNLMGDGLRDALDPRQRGQR